MATVCRMLPLIAHSQGLNIPFHLQVYDWILSSHEIKSLSSHPQPRQGRARGSVQTILKGQECCLLWWFAQAGKIQWLKAYLFFLRCFVFTGNTVYIPHKSFMKYSWTHTGLKWIHNMIKGHNEEEEYNNDADADVLMMMTTMMMMVVMVVVVVMMVEVVAVVIMRRRKPINFVASGTSMQIFHYGDVIIGGIASQITSLTIVYSTVYSDADQGEHQSSASLAFVWGIHRWPVNSPHKWPVTRKIFPFDDVIMIG